MARLPRQVKLCSQHELCPAHGNMEVAVKLMGSICSTLDGKRQAAGFISLHRELLHPAGTDDFLRSSSQK